MKKQNISNPFYGIGKKFLGFGLSGILLFGSASVASAQEKNPEPVVNYIGTLDGQPVFRVHFDNKDKAIYNLTILDDEGALLYAEKITDKEFSKKFKFENAYRDNTKIRFVLSGSKEKRTQVFQVDTNVKTINDVVVTKL